MSITLRLTGLIVPYCKTEITRVYEPINSQGKPAVGKSEPTEV